MNAMMAAVAGGAVYMLLVTLKPDFVYDKESQQFNEGMHSPENVGLAVAVASFAGLWLRGRGKEESIVFFESAGDTFRGLEDV